MRGERYHERDTGYKRGSMQRRRNDHYAEDCYNNNGGWWHRRHNDHDADDGYYNRGGSYGYPTGNYGYGYPGGVYGRGGYGGSSYNIRYQDGPKQTPRDAAQHKPLNPKPRNRKHSYRGYNKS